MTTCCVSEHGYGTGDFWRQNPNGTISVKLSTNRADAFYADFTSPDFYAGTGHMNTKFTGTIEQFCFEDEGVAYCFSFLIEDPSANAWVIHGTAPVTLNGARGNSSRLQMWWNVNPGGGWTNPRLDFNLN